MAKPLKDVVYTDKIISNRDRWLYERLGELKPYIMVGDTGKLQPTPRYYNASLWEKYKLIERFHEKEVYPYHHVISEALIKGVLQHSARTTAKQYPVAGVRKQRKTAKVRDQIYIHQSLVDYWGRIGGTLQLSAA